MILSSDCDNIVLKGWNPLFGREIAAVTLG